MDYKAKTEDFRFEMERKLIKNNDKGGWDKCSFEYLLLRLKEEVTEIEEAIKLERPIFSVIEECADVANFSLMIADNYRELQLKKINNMSYDPGDLQR